ncbi:MAG: SpoVR family protein, partial [Acidobacteria bacterium]|nr:SpoVR family protein [Acidobacteriota bacterium]
EGDLITTVDLSNDVQGSDIESTDIEAKIDLGLDLMKPYMSSAMAVAELKTLEVATEADYQWVTQAGGAATANSQILSILNLVDGIYERDLNLSVTVTFQHVWSSSDPYPATSTQAELDSFLSYWNGNYPKTQYPRDVAHLFTGKFTNQGIAYQSVICSNPAYAYGLTARSGSVTNLITAHEIGHNLGAPHVDNSGTCASSIMNPTLYSNATSFCDVSKSQIQTYIASKGSCLSSAGTTPTPTPVPTVTPIPTPTITPTPTPTVTPKPTITPTPTPTITPTPTPTITPTPTPTPTPFTRGIPTPIPTLTPTPVPTVTPIPTPTITPTPTPDPRLTPTPTITPTPTPFTRGTTYLAFSTNEGIASDQLYYVAMHLTLLLKAIAKV